MNNRLYFSEFREFDISLADLNIMISNIRCIRPSGLMLALIFGMFSKTEEESAITFVKMKD